MKLIWKNEMNIIKNPFIFSKSYINKHSLVFNITFEDFLKIKDYNKKYSNFHLFLIDKNQEHLFLEFFKDTFCSSEKIIKSRNNFFVYKKYLKGTYHIDSTDKIFNELILYSDTQKIVLEFPFQMRNFRNNDYNIVSPYFFNENMTYQFLKPFLTYEKQTDSFSKIEQYLNFFKQFEGNYIEYFNIKTYSEFKINFLNDHNILRRERLLNLFHEYEDKYNISQYFLNYLGPVLYYEDLSKNYHCLKNNKVVVNPNFNLNNYGRCCVIAIFQYVTQFYNINHPEVTFGTFNKSEFQNRLKLRKVIQKIELTKEEEVLVKFWFNYIKTIHYNKHKNKDK